MFDLLTFPLPRPHIHLPIRLCVPAFPLFVVGFLWLVLLSYLSHIKINGVRDIWQKQFIGH